ncbi:hypothetical protein [Litchfieldia alkalitelluris]|uniref:hypothetical protein n=1 Tax=Litchfieldia alkalitelluris TaxID=304268 RepID=UPI0019657EB9|nr:hypothetical protein [Litchfieldia alkalitelluris]
MMSLDIEWIFDQLNKAVFKAEEGKLWELYKINFSKMNSEKDYYSFEDYKKKLNLIEGKEELEKFESKETVEETFNKLKSKVGMK